MTGSIFTKTCTKCQVEKPFTEFSKSKTTKDGYRVWCKSCDRAYRYANKLKINEYLKKYYLENKEHINNNKKEYRIANRDKISEHMKEYYLHNKESVLKQNKEYRSLNKDKIKKYIGSCRGKDAYRNARQKRRALMLSSTIETFSYAAVMDRDRYICQNCGCKTRPDYKNHNHPKYPNLDHIIPLSKGGEHSMRNTQCLCRQCNIKKHNNQSQDQLLLFGY